MGTSPGDGRTGPGCFFRFHVRSGSLASPLGTPVGRVPCPVRHDQGGAEAAPKTTMNATPVPVKQVATAAGQNPGDVVVGFDMGLFDLAFILPQDTAKRLHAALGSALGG